MKISILKKLQQTYSKWKDSLVMNLSQLDKFSQSNLGENLKNFSGQLNVSNQFLLKNISLIVTKQIKINKNILNNSLGKLFDDAIKTLQRQKNQHLQTLKQNLLDFKNLPYNVKLQNLQLLDNNLNKDIINQGNIDNVYKNLLTKTINDVFGQYNKELQNLTVLKTSVLNEKKLFKACQLATNNNNLDLAKILVGLIKQEKLENNYLKYLGQQNDNNKLHKSLLKIESNNEIFVSNNLDIQNLRKNLNDISQNLMLVQTKQFQNYNSLQHNHIKQFKIQP